MQIDLMDSKIKRGVNRNQEHFKDNCFGYYDGQRRDIITCSSDSLGGQRAFNQKHSQ